MNRLPEFHAAKWDEPVVMELGRPGGRGPERAAETPGACGRPQHGSRDGTAAGPACRHPVGSARSATG